MLKMICFLENGRSMLKMVGFLENGRLDLALYVYAPALQILVITAHSPLKSLPEPHFLYNFLSFASLAHIFLFLLVLYRIFILDYLLESVRYVLIYMFSPVFLGKLYNIFFIIVK